MKFQSRAAYVIEGFSDSGDGDDGVDLILAITIMNSERIDATLSFHLPGHILQDYSR